MTILHGMVIVFNLTVLPAIFWMLAMVLFTTKYHGKNPITGYSSSHFKQLTYFERAVWGFKDFYILWYSMFRKKRYVLKLHIDDYAEIKPLRDFCNQYFHGLFAVQFGILDADARDNYYSEIIHSITQVATHGAPKPVANDPPPMYMDAKFLFEKDALWFALHHGNKIV